jgi:hypothetical protein
MSALGPAQEIHPRVNILCTHWKTSSCFRHGDSKGAGELPAVLRDVRLLSIRTRTLHYSICGSEGVYQQCNTCDALDALVEVVPLRDVGSELQHRVRPAKLRAGEGACERGCRCSSDAPFFSLCGSCRCILSRSRYMWHSLAAMVIAQAANGLTRQNSCPGGDAIQAFGMLCRSHHVSDRNASTGVSPRSSLSIGFSASTSRSAYTPPSARSLIY